MTGIKGIRDWARGVCGVGPSVAGMARIEGISRFRKLDVREAIERGEQPLPRIRATLAKLAPDEALAVQAPFLPAPLIELLGSEGYESRFEPGLRGEWTVYFWRANR